MTTAIVRILCGTLAVAAATLALFVLNGLVLAHRESPVLGTTANPARSPRRDADGIEVRVVAYNIAKAFAYRQGLRFEHPKVVRQRLDALAAVIRDLDPDLVFLSEVLHECPPCGDSQVEYLAEHTGAHAWAFGECYNVGLPFFRVSGGTAILSRLPLTPDVNLTLAGRKPFWVSANNRRALFAEATIGETPLLLGSLHNDSRAGPDNTAQIRQILAHCAGRQALLAGDFNAWPSHPSMGLVRASTRFTPIIDQYTHPADLPNRTIDYVLAPASWELVEYRVVDTQVSDHRPVFARFRVRAAYR